MADMEETKHAWVWAGGVVIVIAAILTLWGVTNTQHGFAAGREMTAATTTTATR